MKQINPNIYPKGGYFFKDQDGSVHPADSWEGVIKRVIAYRARLGRPTENTRSEVITQACQRHPNLCVEDNGVTGARQKQASLKSRVLTWLLSMVKAREADRLRFVSDDMHAARTDVCIRCPMDKSLPTGCGACKASLREFRERIVGKRVTDARIEACPVLGEYLPVSTWFDEPTVPNPALWHECWRRRSV